MANAKPHTHELEIDTSRYRPSSWRITYGDQTTYVWKHFPGWRGRLRRKAQRIVKWHDKGSVWAATDRNPEVYTANLVLDINNKVLITEEKEDRFRPGVIRVIKRTSDEHWGRDLLKRKESA